MGSSSSQTPKDLISTDILYDLDSGVPLGDVKKNREKVQIQILRTLSNDLTKLYEYTQDVANVLHKTADVKFILHTLKINGTSTTDTPVSSTEQDGVAYAHSSILVSRSQYFCALFEFDDNKSTTLQISEKQLKVIHLEQIPSLESFHLLLNFLYSGTIEKITEENVVDMYSLANQYLVTELKLMCTLFVQKSINASNVYDLIHWSVNYNHSDIYQLCLSYLATNLSGLFDEKFLVISYDVLLLIVKYDGLYVDEYVLFEGVIKWLKNARKNQQEIKQGNKTTTSSNQSHTERKDSLSYEKMRKRLISYIRFPIMNFKDLFIIKDKYSSSNDPDRFVPKKFIDEALAYKAALYQYVEVSTSQQPTRQFIEIDKNDSEPDDDDENADFFQLTNFIDEKDKVENWKIFADAKKHHRTKPRAGKEGLLLKDRLYYESDFDTNGIIYWIGTNENPSSNVYINPAVSGKIAITQSSHFSNVDTTSTLVDREQGDSWTGGEKMNGWIQFDFKNYRIKPSKYCIRNSYIYDSYFLRTWNLLGSNDELNWTIIKEHVDDSTVSQVMNGTTSWDIDEQRLHPFKFLRLVINGPLSHHGFITMGFGGFEVWGTIYELPLKT
ncbi:unnamed protein product [Didymodactylos carnosus]|uniref:BTB domain-containing protein n=1 Tax=Didymodactylos carnosus TaxID=1234261 RepID=A0A8S2I470_9BILA|nr:unnamed protein product [Didymodactylos carnosus]CAF3711225.1 unnamed protein product [Didymodactylos carnosus]